MRSFEDHAGQGEESDGVGDDHQLVEQIGELPDKIVGGQSSEENEDQGDDLVDDHGSVAKQVDRVDAAEHIPAEHCRKGKEEQADSDEDVAEACAEYGAEGCLRQIGLGDHFARRTDFLSGVSVGQLKVSMKTPIMATTPWS